MFAPEDFCLKMIKQTTKERLQRPGITNELLIPFPHTHSYRGNTQCEVVGWGRRGEEGANIKKHANTPCTRRTLQSGAPTKLTSEHVISTANRVQLQYHPAKDTAIQSTCNLLNPGSTTTGRLEVQHMRAYLVLLKNRKCYPVLLFHSGKKRHLKAMLCRGMVTLQSSSLRTSTKKSSSQHSNPCTTCRLSSPSPPCLSMLRLMAVSYHSSWLTSICQLPRGQPCAQDDLLQYSCKSPTGGHTETNTIVLFHKAEHIVGDRGQTVLAGDAF